MFTFGLVRVKETRRIKADGTVIREYFFVFEGEDTGMLFADGEVAFDIHTGNSN
jgi:hypothetical protein